VITLETDEDTHQASLLMTAPGPEGSGRIRYAAAMYFFQRGMLSEAALELFRISSAIDHEDPLLSIKLHKLDSEISRIVG
jgi:hypothetical protein